jgi:hypothetical protein
MLISHTHRFIFVHIPKTGGMSVKQTLQPYAHRAERYHWNRLLDGLGIRVNYIGPATMRRFRKHATARQIRRHLPAEIYDSYFKFAFVRNPWDRMVSYYHFMISEPEHHRHRRVKSMQSFEEYLRYEIRRGKASQKRLITDVSGRLLVDFVGRYECLPDDFGQVCRQVAIPFDLGHCNKSTHRDYREYYQPDTIQLVQEHFREDIEFFGYTFDGWSESPQVGEAA